MIKLPHQEPIKFVQNILYKCENNLSIDCKFPFHPTLAMVCEAAAQGTAAFAQNTNKPKMGFLVALKNIEQLKAFDKKEFEIYIEKSFEFGVMSEYNFKLINNSQEYGKGTLTIAIEE